MENLIKKDDLGGKPTIFWKHPYREVRGHFLMACFFPLRETRDEKSF